MALTNSDPGRLIAGAPEAVQVSAIYVLGRGWHLRLSVRRQFQSWAQAAQGDYQDLTTPELVQVLDDAICCELDVEAGDY